MKALFIKVDVPPKYVHTTEDRDALKVGQKLKGHVALDGPGKPTSCEIRWLDAHGRLLGRTAGEFDARQRAVRFEFDLAHSWFNAHYIECSLDGKKQDARARFIVSPTGLEWDQLHAITWAFYPFGDFYDQLQALGVNGIIAYKQEHFDHVVEHGMKCYVDQMTFDEISVFHRPFKLYWEPPDDFKGTPSSISNFPQNWKALLEKYKRARARYGVEGFSRNDHARKLLWRPYCPNDPGTITVAGARFKAGVRHHKGARPAFYNIADEAGIGDQTRPFDFCYCPFCMEKFRALLEEKYGSLAELNRQWGTDFTSWYDVYPLTTDETLARVKRGAPLNFSSWADHREFMDSTFADFFAEMRRQGRQVDPIGVFSTGGTQWPTVYGGWDYPKLVRAVDLLIPYNLGGNQELIRSIAPNVKNISPYFGDDERQVRQMWFSAIHGDAGFIFWDFDEETGRFVRRPDGAVSKRGKLFGPALREIRGGAGQQFRLWERRNDPIGLLYSQPSERAHWMLEALADRPQMDWFERVYRSRYVNVRFSWQFLIEDRQLQWRYLSYLDLRERNLDLSGYRMIVLPQSLALSAAEIKALRQFVHEGGVLVADGRCARFAENCRQADAGLLDDLFGVVQGKDVTLKTGAALRLAGKGADPWHGLSKEMAALKALDAGLRLDPAGGAEALAKAGQAPTIIRRRFGQGWAVFLNLDLSTYHRDRYVLDKPRALACRHLLDALARLAGITPTVEVADRTLGSTAGIEATRFAQCGAEQFAFVMNRPWSVSGVGDAVSDETLAVFETDRELALAFAAPAHTYNARSGTYLGHVTAVQETLPRLTPLIVSRLPYKVDGVNVAKPPSARPGDVVTLDIRLTGETPTAEHVVRVDVHQPDGTWCYWYSNHTVAKAGAARFTIPLALNDPKGRWTVTARDAVTGFGAETSFAVR